MFAVPNALTILRILLVPVFAIAFVMPGDVARIVAFIVFVIAGVSDWLDGFAARKLNAGSEFGRMLDPIADKVLVAVAKTRKATSRAALPGITKATAKTGTSRMRRMVRALGRPVMASV